VRVPADPSRDFGGSMALSVLDAISKPPSALPAVEADLAELLDSWKKNHIATRDCDVGKAVRLTGHLVDVGSRQKATKGRNPLQVRPLR
jgi:hypothetical protein